MRSAAKLVLALGAALSLAPAPRGDGEPSARSEMADPQCGEHGPRITVERFHKDQANSTIITFLFGDINYIICCGDDSSSQIMTKNGKLLITKQYQEKCIMYESVADRLESTEYVCTHSVTKCKHSVIVTTKPAVFVASPNIMLSENFTEHYIIPYGNSMKISCSGPYAERMTLTKDGQSLVTNIEGYNSVTWVEETPDLQISEYVCIDADTTYNSSVLIKVVPAIYLQYRNKRIPESAYRDTLWYRVEYNEIVDFIEVCCSGPRAVKLINKEDDSNVAITDNPNKTLAKILLEKLGMGRWSFICLDSKTFKYRSSFVLEVSPKIDVISPNVTKTDDGTIVSLYGKPVEIICSGPDAKQLTLFKEYTDVMEDIETVNQTTIKLFVIKPDIPKSTYICEHANSTRQSVNIRVHLGLDIHVKYHNELIYYYFTPVFIPYGDSVDIFCSGAGTVQLIRPDKNNTKIYAEDVNSTTIRALMANLTVGRMEIACVDREDMYYESTETLVLEVLPRMEVTSFDMVSEFADRTISVQFGNSLEITCSGPNAKQLILCKDDTIIHDTRTVNETTIKWSVNKPSISWYNEYSCSAGYYKSYVFVAVNVVPEPVGFHCVAHYKQSLNCSWTVLSTSSNFTFSHVEKGTICASSEIYTQDKFCVWDGSHYPSYPSDLEALSFLIQSCNGLGCTNHTYSIDHASILKPPPPEYLRVVKTSSRSVGLAWEHSYIYDPYFLSSDNGDFIYKVEYWYSGIQPLQVNSTLVTCIRQPDTCNFLLKLPCPGVNYQAWVYQKLKRTIGEEYWSDPSTILFFLDDEYDATKIEDLQCTQNPIMDKYVKLNEVHELRRHLRKEMRRNLREKRISLKRKLALLRAAPGEL